MIHLAVERLAFSLGKCKGDACDNPQRSKLAFETNVGHGSRGFLLSGGNDADSTHGPLRWSTGQVRGVPKSDPLFM